MEILKTVTELTFRDILGGWKVRWGFGRNTYMIKPGIYQIGVPDKESPVLVTANYKLTFDQLRKELNDIRAWILVLDTKGVNVWCAAGKGTFSDSEIINRINSTDLRQLVSHRILILPQLSAPGVKGSEVTGKTGFKILFGPVYAADIPEYLSSGRIKTEKMKIVRFSPADRLKVIPVELTGTLKPLAVLLIVSVFYTVISAGGTFSFANALKDWGIYAGAVISGAFVVPLLLPLIPFRSFALKGAFTGLLFASFYSIAGKLDTVETFSAIMIASAISSYLALNFTGSSTFTSLSGVRREVKTALPVYIVMLAAGAAGKIFSALTNIL